MDVTVDLYAQKPDGFSDELNTLKIVQVRLFLHERMEVSVKSEVKCNQLIIFKQSTASAVFSYFTVS